MREDVWPGPHDGYELEFEDTFEDPALNRKNWSPFYLPHWSSRQRSTAAYEIRDSHLRLRIERDREPWCPEFDGDVRVSALQTGAFAGPVGSRIGQLHFNPDVIVREEQPDIRLYTPLYGVVELRAKAIAEPASMVALWMMGYEDQPERSGEICICEIFGRDVGTNTVKVGMGIHPFADPQLTDDFSAVEIPIDARQFHVYSAEWTPEGVEFYVDRQLVKTVDQAPTYPMQLMLAVYEFREGGEPAGSYPKEFVVDYVRGYRRKR